MPDQLKCQFCGNPATLLCDGRLDDGRTCSANLCKACTTRVGGVFLHYARRKDGRRCGVETEDLCPTCKAANHKTNFLGVSQAEAKRILGAETKPVQAALFGPQSRDYQDD